MQVPGTGISALSWEGGSLRVALAVDSYIYFANIRPDYRWGFFGDTLVAAYAQPERTDSTVLFWNTKTDEKVLKYHNKLLTVKAASENCVLAMQAEVQMTGGNTGLPPAAQYNLLLCNAIGSPLDSKYIDVKPDFLCITAHHVVAASADFVYVWHYRTLMSKLTSVRVRASVSVRVRVKLGLGLRLRLRFGFGLGFGLGFGFGLGLGCYRTLMSQPTSVDSAYL